jgi:hypothetical protein
MTLSVDEFLRRFLLHVLPYGFVRIRFFGFMANRRRASLLPLCETLIGPQKEPPSEVAKTWVCPHCGGPMIVIQRLTAHQIICELPTRINGADSS